MDSEKLQKANDLSHKIADTEKHLALLKRGGDVSVNHVQVYIPPKDGFSSQYVSLFLDRINTQDLLLVYTARIERYLNELKAEFDAL